MNDWKFGHPEKPGRYIVTIVKDATTSMECDWNGSKWYHPNKPDLLFDEVVAWMEMPKPYLQTEQ